MKDSQFSQSIHFHEFNFSACQAPHVSDVSGCLPSSLEQFDVSSHVQCDLEQQCEEQFCIKNSNPAGKYLGPVMRDERKSVVCARLPPTEPVREGESKLEPFLSLAPFDTTHPIDSGCSKLRIRDCKAEARGHAGRHILDALLFVVYSHYDTLCVDRVAPGKQYTTFARDDHIDERQTKIRQAGLSSDGQRRLSTSGRECALYRPGGQSDGSNSSPLGLKLSRAASR